MAAWLPCFSMYVYLCWSFSYPSKERWLPALQMRALHRLLPHQGPHFAVLKLEFTSLKPVSLKLLLARNMRLDDNLWASLEFPGIWYLSWHFGRREEQSQGPKSLFTAQPPWPSLLGPIFPHPSLLFHIHEFYLLWHWVEARIKLCLVIAVILFLSCFGYGFSLMCWWEKKI